MKVSYAMSTYRKAKQFNEALINLQESVDPMVIRAYFSSENEIREANVWELSESQRKQLEELEALRMDGIRSEMKYALAQAKKNGVMLSEDIVSGKSVVPGFSREFLEKVPSLGVYSLFLLFTEKELDSYLQSSPEV